MGADVAVDQPRHPALGDGPVRVGQRTGHLLGDVHRPWKPEPDVELAAAVQHLAQALRVDQLHGDGVAPLDEVEVEDVDDVGVVQAAGQAGLLREHPDHLVVVAAVGADELHGHLLHESGRAGDLGAPHLGHPARGDGLDEEVFSEPAHGAGL